MPVGQMLASMSSRELSEWVAFYRVEPFGEERADLRSALQTATVANMKRGKGKRPFKLSDFLLKFDWSVKEDLRHGQVDQQALAAKVKSVLGPLLGKGG